VGVQVYFKERTKEGANKMRVFEKPNLQDGKWKCPICGTAEEKPVVLISITGTIQGNVCRATQFHLDCLNLHYAEDEGLIYQAV